MGRTLRVVVNDKAFEVDIIQRSRDVVEFSLEGRSYRVAFEKSTSQSTGTAAAKIPRQSSSPSQVIAVPGDSSQCHITAPIPGVVVEICVVEGETVAAGDVLLRLEAMKMQNNIFAPIDGSIGSIAVSQGEEVSDGQLLLELVPRVSA